MGAAQPRAARSYVVWSGLLSSSSAGDSQPCRTPTTHDAFRKAYRISGFKTVTTHPTDFLLRCHLASDTGTFCLEHVDWRTVSLHQASQWTVIHSHHFIHLSLY